MPTTANTLAGFNPLPALRPGDTPGAFILGEPTGCFNPLPALRPGDTFTPPLMDLVIWMFQSTPGFKAGRYAMSRSHQGTVHSFNPLPALRPGDTKSPIYSYVTKKCFNPLPALRPGDTL